MTQMTNGQEARKQMMVSTGTYCATAQTGMRNAGQQSRGTPPVASTKRNQTNETDPQRRHVGEKGADEAEHNQRKFL